MSLARTGCFLACAAIALAAAACSGGASSPAVSCGSPPPSAIPWLDLVYPMPGATAVPDAIGSLIFADPGVPAQDFVSLSAPGATVPVGSFTAAPSPIPSPHVTPGAGFSGNVPYVAAPIPTLSPATTYMVNYTYQDWADNPPSCTTMRMQSLGSFTTQ